ncbi:hypothetical protein C5167_011854 [Papaver somniferum]|uniref:Uncharacterized protein n=1 Tax=Papaver somniferum TaxID=3469 RepID=A0A4Y7IZ23_PAPSO|nr:hypothetical protein C5167_011854 [Papaver somniferum]
MPPVMHQGGGDDLGDDDNLAEDGMGGVDAGADMPLAVLKNVVPLNAPNLGLPIQGPEFLIILHNLYLVQINVRAFQQFLPTAPWLGNWANFQASLIARGFIQFKTMRNRAEYSHRYFIQRYLFRVMIDYHPSVRHRNPRILPDRGDEFDRITGPEFHIEVGGLPTSIRLFSPERLRKSF